MVVYKYLTIKKAHLWLDNRKIIFTPPKYFNDINEVLPCASYNIPDSIKTDPKLPGYVNKYRNQMNNQSSLEIISSIRHSRKLLNAFKKDVYKRNKLVIKEFPEMMSKNIAIMCCSSSFSSNVMWGHYTDNHQGICIGIDITKDKYPLVDTSMVEYKNERIEIPHLLAVYKGDDLMDFMEKLVFTKDEEWDYEKEIRSVVPIKDSVLFNNDGTEYYTVDLNLDDIKEVYIGKRFDHTMNSDITSLFNENIIKQMAPSENEFKLVSIEYKSQK